MCISKSWLGADIEDNGLLIDDYKIVRLDRNRHGGGVALYITTHKVIYSGNRTFECLFLFNFIIVFVYCTDLLIVVI